MKTHHNNTILLILAFVFFSMFRFNAVIKESVIASSNLWFTALVPSMMPMYAITDLLMNYGLANVFYKIFKNNRAILIFISMILGTPANAKYIREFYKTGYIELDEASYLLSFAYSPNPLFILGIAPSKKIALITLFTIYATNAIIALFNRKNLIAHQSTFKTFKAKEFTECLEDSIKKSFEILVLVYGIVVVYGIINSLIEVYIPNVGFFLRSILEISNALGYISSMSKSFHKWMIVASLFGGLSIHTQIKSIICDTEIPFKNFFISRLFATCIGTIVCLFL